MTLPIDRLKTAIENIFTQPPAPDKPSWGDRLRGWMVSSAVKGITAALEDMTPEQKTAAETVAKHLIDDPDVPTDIKDLLQKAGMKGNPLLTFLRIWLAGFWLSDIVVKRIVPQDSLLGYKTNRTYQQFRLDPLSVTTAWRRDKPTYEKYFDDLRDQGWSDDRIDALKFFTEIIPGVSDLVRMAVREAFTPEIAEKFGQYQDYPEAITEWGEKQGLSKEWLTRYWAAHWDLPAPTQGFEMLHRGVIDEDTLKMLLRALDVMPFWRDKLIDISWNIPTRVDIRRFFDMRTIDEARLRELYAAMGYHGKDLDDYVLWTKIYVDLPDLIARWKNGWLELADVRARLIADGMDPVAADELIQTKVKAVEPATTAEGNLLTKTEIYKGVKLGVITYEQGLDLLMDLNYSRDQADYLLTTNVQALAGSPETYIDFKDMTQKYRKAVGLESQAVTDELRKAANEVVKLTRDLKSLQDGLTEEDRKLIEAEVLPPEATKRRDELRVILHRAESALAAAKSNYDRLVAEWRHKA